MRLAVVIPTIGRRALVDALASVVPQLGAEDLVYVMYDGEEFRMRYDCGDVMREYNADWERVWFYAMPYGEGGLGGYGHPQRNRALELLPQDIDWVWSFDDDDVAAPHALYRIRITIETVLGQGSEVRRWYAFRMHFGPNSHAAGHTCWREEKVALGNIGTPCIVMPRHAKSRWGTLGTDPRTGLVMGDGYFGDYELACDLEAELGPPVFVPHVVCEVRP